MNPRLQLIEKLGSKCASCGDEDIRTLVIEHKLGNGYLEKWWFKQNKFDMYETYLEDFKFEKQYIQVFCYNCNVKKKLTLNEVRGRIHFSDVPLFCKPFNEIDPNEFWNFIDKNPIFEQTAIRQLKMIIKLVKKRFDEIYLEKEAWEQEL